MDIQKHIQDLLSRGKVKLSNRASKMRELQAEFLAGEVRDELEHIEPYGFSSEPITDGKAEAFVMFLDGNRSNGIVFCVADRRYRITNMESGEVAIFDDQGQKVYLQRGGILLETPKNLTAKVGGSTTLTSSGNVDITAPQTTIHGPLTVDGPISGKSGMAITGDDVTADGISLKNHVHTGDSGGTTGTAR